MGIFVSEAIKALTMPPTAPSTQAIRQLYGCKQVHRMGSNENPWGCSPRARERAQEGLQSLHLYPRPEGIQGLREALGKYHSWPVGGFTFGNGSSELIDICIRAFGGKGVVSTSPTFMLYKAYSLIAGVPFYEVPLGPPPEAKFSPQLMAQKVLQTGASLVFLANPNNPTGSVVSHRELEDLLRVLKDSNVLVVLDEAYWEYARHGEGFPQFAQLFKKYPFLVSLRTFSKVHALAGLRFGVLVGSKEVVRVVDTLRSPFNVNVVAQHAALGALEDTDYVEKVCRLSAEGREFLQKSLLCLGLKCWHSSTGFVLFDTGFCAHSVCAQLLAKGFVLRPAVASGLPTAVRVSVGTRDQNQQLVKVLPEVLSAVSAQRGAS